MSTAVQASSRPAEAPKASDVRLRVLHLINSFEAGGTERQAVELLKHIDLDRYDVRVGALRNVGEFSEEIAARFPNIREFEFKNFYSRAALAQLRRLRRLIESEQIDVVHTHDFYSGLLGASAAKLAGARVIAAQRHLKLSDRLVHRWGSRAIHRMADRILVNSEAIREHIVQHDGADRNKITVIRNGIASTDQEIHDGRTVREELCRELGLAGDAILIGTVARLQEVKGHRFLIEAAARVIEHEPRAHFVLVGDGPLRDELEAQARRLGIPGRIHFLGYRDDASHLAAAFDVMTLPSLHEGLPNAVMEAMSAGVPVVATSVGGTLELIQDGRTGYLVEPADAARLADQLTFALSDSRKQSIADAGRRFVLSQFGVERMVLEVQTLYDQFWSAATRRRLSEQSQRNELRQAEIR